MCKVNCYKSVLIFFISAAAVIPQKLVTAKQTLCENLLKVDFEHYIQKQATPKSITRMFSNKIKKFISTKTIDNDIFVLSLFKI